MLKISMIRLAVFRSGKARVCGAARYMPFTRTRSDLSWYSNFIHKQTRNRFAISRAAILSEAFAALSRSFPNLFWSLFTKSSLRRIKSPDFPIKARSESWENPSRRPLQERLSWQCKRQGKLSANNKTHTRKEVIRTLLDREYQKKVKTFLWS